MITDDALRSKILIPQAATFGMMGLITAFGVAYRLAESYEIDAASAGIISLCAFLIATPFVTSIVPEGAKKAITVTDVIPTTFMGSAGIFVAIILAIFSKEVYRYF